MTTKNINTNTNINKININIPKPRQPKPKSINQAEQELKDLESKDYQYSRTPSLNLSVNPNVYGFNTTPIGAQNRVFERPSTPTISIEEQQAKQADQQERTRQAQEEIQTQEEIARQQAEFQEQQDELFRGESMDRSGLGNVRQSYFQSRGGNDFQNRLNQQIPIAEAYPSEYETENETLATRMRNTSMGKSGVALQQKMLDDYQQESRKEERKSRRGRKAGTTNRPKKEIDLEKTRKEQKKLEKQKRDEGKQKTREMRAKQEDDELKRIQEIERQAKEAKDKKEQIKKEEEAMKDVKPTKIKKAKGALRGQNEF